MERGSRRQTKMKEKAVGRVETDGAMGHGSSESGG